MTLIDGNREVPVLQYKDGRLIDPLKLFWSKVKNDETCDVEEVFKSAV